MKNELSTQQNEMKQISYDGPLIRLIKGLNSENKVILIGNIELKERASIAKIIETIKHLIEDHKVIFDCKESLFFKHTGKQIWIKHD